MATLSNELTIRQFEKLRSEMVDLKSRLSARVQRESNQLESLPDEEGEILEMQPKPPDGKKSDLANELAKLKLNILEIKVMKTDLSI